MFPGVERLPNKVIYGLVQCKTYLKLFSNNTALLVAPEQSAQSLPNSLLGKYTTMQTVTVIHRLDLTLVGVFGCAIMN